MRKAHGPGKAAGCAVVAVARGKAADTPDAIAQGRRGRTQVEHAERAQLRAARLKQQSPDTADQASEPGQARAVKQQRRVRDQCRGVLQNVPQLRAYGTGNGRNGNNADRLRPDLMAAEIAVQQNGGKRGREVQHEAKRRQCEPPDVQVRQHKVFPQYRRLTCNERVRAYLGALSCSHT